MFRRFLSAALVVALPLLSIAADVTIVGSDLLRAALAPVSATKRADGGVVRLQLAGSRGALDALRGAQADLAVVAFTPDELLPDQEFTLIPLAYQVVVFAVNENNPVHSVTLGQLGGMFGEGEVLNLRQWADLGAKDEWARKSINLGLVDDPDSVGVDLFRRLVLASPQMRTSIEQLPTAEALLRKVHFDDSSVGLFLHPLPVVPGVHVLLVAKSASDVPFSPSAENVHAGDYPLRLPFYVAVLKSRAGELRDVLARLLGAQVADSVEQNGFVAVPANARLDLRRSLGIE